MQPLTLQLLRRFSWPAWVQHPWRHGVAVLAVALGVALALAVHLINASALAEFGQAVATVNGQPDLSLRARQGTLDDRWIERAQASPGVDLASPVIDSTVGWDADGATRHTLRLLGVDALSVAAVAPDVLPRVFAGEPTGNRARLDFLAADAVFANPAALALLGDVRSLRLRTPNGREHTVRLAGTVGAAGAPLLVMDVAAAQDLLGWAGQISRLDLRLAAGASDADVLGALQLPPQLLALPPETSGQRASSLSRAYRVNLTVLALVALFTGGFLVFSVLSLSVARRQPQFALLGVLGLDAAARRRLVLTESALLGVVGALLGVALGSALAALALRLLGGDLGGGYFSGVSPSLRFSWLAALTFGTLGVLASVAGGWWPARAMERLAPALALKGLGGGAGAHRLHGGWPWALMALAAALAFVPPVAGVPLAAYASVALLLLGGMGALPWAVNAALPGLARRWAHRPLWLLALSRAHRERDTAAVALSGVVASLALAVALTVMVASFRDSVGRWLDSVLPAPLYLRAAGSGPADGRFLDPALIDAVRALPGVARADALRATPVQLDALKPPVTMIARSLPAPDSAEPLPLPLVGRALARAEPGAVPVWVSEAMVDLYGARVGDDLPALAQALVSEGQRPPRLQVLGVWRDYARQHGSVAMQRDDYVLLSGDTRVNDLAVVPAPGTAVASLQSAIEALPQAGALEMASADEIRAISLRIFDRSFAVTVWLQAVAIGIGLFGVAASFSAQVLARQREFGLLAHLGLTQGQVQTLVAMEGLAWTTLGAAGGLLLGLGVSVVLVHVVNPQSFHWTMDMALPWARLLALCVAVVLAGTLTAWLAGRGAAQQNAVRSVKDDW
jgi:putative ABC transport system permease protein